MSLNKLKRQSAIHLPVSPTYLVPSTIDDPALGISSVWESRDTISTLL
jgi:hypothetical protein